MIEELHRFILVATEGNVTKAAEKIFITQSALSQSIKRLESVLGTKLFIPKGKSLQVTTDGLAVIAIGKKILQLWENAKNPQVRQSLRPTYAIGMFDNASLRLGKYFQNHIAAKEFNLELTIGTSATLLSQLHLGILDVAICVLDNKYPHPKDLLLLKTFQEHLLPVASKKFSVSFDNLPFILYNKGSHTRAQIDAVFTKRGITPNVFAESTSVTFMRELALLGCGIALLPENFVKQDLKQGILKKQKLPLTWKREYGIYIQKQGKLDKDHAIIKELVKNLK